MTWTSTISMGVWQALEILAYATIAGGFLWSAIRQDANKRRSHLAFGAKFNIATFAFALTLCLAEGLALLISLSVLLVGLVALEVQTPSWGYRKVPPMPPDHLSRVEKRLTRLSVVLAPVNVVLLISSRQLLMPPEDFVRLLLLTGVATVLMALLGRLRTQRKESSNEQL